jgi:hypothetical protein
LIFAKVVKKLLISRKFLELRRPCKEIHDVVTLQPFISYHDVFKLATKVEKQLKEKEVKKQRALVVAEFSIEAIQ